MELEKKLTVGFAMCGSFCTFARSIAVMAKLRRAGHEIIPIMSDAAYNTDTRFGKASEIREKAETVCGKRVISTIKDAEPLGPEVKLDMLILSPCTGNTLAKLAHGITDTAVTMACKAHLRADRPLLICLATNDAMSGNLENLAGLLRRKNVYFVPMRQDDPQKKPHSLVGEFERIPEAMSAAMEGKQLRPLFTC